MIKFSSFTEDVGRHAVEQGQQGVLSVPQNPACGVEKVAADKRSGSHRFLVWLCKGAFEIEHHDIEDFRKSQALM